MKIKALKEFNLKMRPGDVIEVADERYEKIKKIDGTLVEVVEGRPDKQPDEETKQQSDEETIIEKATTSTRKATKSN